MPFFKEAPGGRLTVSMTEVVDTNTGSEMSDFAIDFFLSMPCLIMGCTALGLKAAVFGVVGLDTGGVWFADRGGSGEGCGEWALMFGLVKPPGEGLGDTGSPGENLACGIPSRGDTVPGGAPVWIGCRCLDSK